MEKNFCANFEEIWRNSENILTKFWKEFDKFDETKKKFDKILKTLEEIKKIFTIDFQFDQSLKTF